MKRIMYEILLLLYILLRIISSCFCFISHYHSSNSSDIMAFSCLPHQSSILLQLKRELFHKEAEEDYEDYSHSKMRHWKEGSDCCFWDGVSCNIQTGDVVSLDLSRSWIDGPLGSNSSLFKLPNLQKLNLAYNNFNECQIPAEFGQLSRLTHLNLSNSMFSGPIPSEIILRLTNLISLDLSADYYHNGLSLDPELLRRLPQNMTSLRQLYLGGVNIPSRVPESLANLSSFTHLSLAGCNLDRDFPKSIIQLPNIQVVHLSDNYDLTGSLPEFHFGSNLTSLLLQNTNFGGKIPNSIGNLKSLQVLDLSHCSFRGSTPYSVWNLSQLSYLDFSRNNFSGHFPFSLDLPQLEYLHLNENNFRGQIPSSLGNLTQLNSLDISNNFFHGQLPFTVGNLAKIRELHLDGNEFSGEFLPLLNLPQLESLYLGHNNFSSQVPSSLGNLTHLTALDFSNNFFHGSFPKSLPYHLDYISFSNNSLMGSIPSHTFNNLTFLYYLDLSYNSLNGSIPLSLLSATSLGYLHLEYNEFVSLESIISASSQLEYLGLSGNKLNGGFPSSIFKMKNLLDLFLDSNNLSGRVDFGNFTELSSLMFLDLSYNILSVTNLTINHALPKFQLLSLSSCNITEFPDFLKAQNYLDILDLSHNTISSAIPEWFSSKEMLFLSELRLSHNFLSGWEEAPSILPWKNMNYLDLSSNIMQGPLVVPPMSTWYFFISNNNLTGGIDPLFCKLRDLIVLDASNNTLRGPIPHCLDNLDGSLNVLNLRRNNFNGNIPRICRGKSQLQTLDLSHNQLHGNIPRSLVKCRNLQVLDFGYNQIKDTFPFWLQNLQSLEVLMLGSNKFHGHIWRAHNFVGFKAMKIIDLSRNGFVGSLPLEYFRNWTSMSTKISQIAYESKNFSHEDGYYNDSVTIINKGQKMELVKTLTIFRSLDFSNNKFDGEIPSTLWGLQSLVMLNLSSNNFSGLIPSSIGNLVELESLDLSSNRLSGKIPHHLIALTFLEYLNLSHNRLEGPIPQGGQVSTFENSSFEGNLGLCGIPLSRICETPQPASNDHYNENIDFISGFGLKAVVIGYGCGLLIGLVVGHVISSRSQDLIFKVFGVRLTIN